MTLLAREQLLARLRTVRIVFDDGAVRFTPAVHVGRSLLPDPRHCFDRLGKR